MTESSRIHLLLGLSCVLGIGASLGFDAKSHAVRTQVTEGAAPQLQSMPRLAPALVHSPDIRVSSYAVPQRIVCGAGSCDPKTSYCEVVQSDVLELPSDFTCRPLPSACEASDDCTCFPRGTRCSDFCSRTAKGPSGGFRLTCVGGR
ncbi:MAG: hypothetical protein R3B07_36125 [Polyangiaceae bacterium]